MSIPATIWRAITIELWRLILLTTGVLVTVLAFSVSIKLLADGKLGPIDTLRFMTFAMVPMLQYALPFAAGFAATIVYHRMAADNELVACHAGGIGHRTLLAPSIITGLVLALMVLTLTGWVIPRFLRSMQNIVREDATRLFVSSIEKGEAVQLGSRLIFADSVERLGPEEASGAFQRLWLTGVLAVELDRAGDADIEGSAPEAFVWFYQGGQAAAMISSTGARVESLDGGPVDASDEDTTLVIMQTRGSTGGRKQKMKSEGDATFAFVTRDAFVDNPRYYEWSRLAELRANPDALPQVDGRRRALAAALAERALTSAVQESFRRTSRCEVLDQYGSPAQVRGLGISWDASVRWWRIEPAEDGRVTFTRRTEEGREQVLRARKGWLRTIGPWNSDEHTTSFTLKLEQAVVAGASGAAATESEERTYAGMHLAEDPVPAILSASSRELLDRAEASPQDEFVAGPAKNLSRRIRDLRREIMGKQSERVAAGVACLVMVITGAIMAMRLRESLPLNVYLWSFFPALGALITVAAGSELTHHYGTPGLFMLWGGVGVLAAYAYAVFRRVARR